MLPCALLLLRVPGGRKVYGAAFSTICSYLGERHESLPEAVAAALLASTPVVYVTRNATLQPPPGEPESTMDGFHFWCEIPRGCRVRLVSTGGPWRLRFYCMRYHHTQKSEAIFALRNGARLEIDHVRMEMIGRKKDSESFYLCAVEPDSELDMTERVSLVGGLTTNKPK